MSARWHTDPRTCSHGNDDVCPTCDFDGYYAATYPECPWREAVACEWCNQSDGQHANGCRLGLGPDEPDALDSLPIAALLHSRLASWFGDDRQSFLVSDLVPVVTQIVAEFQHNAVEMSRKASVAEARAEEAEYHVEQLRDACDSAERAIERVERLVDGWEQDGPDDPAMHLLIRRVREALSAASIEDVCPTCGGSMRFCECMDDPFARAPDEHCDHEWLERPESDTRECLICGTEEAG